MDDAHCVADVRKQDDLLGKTHCLNDGAVDCLNQPVSAELLYRTVQAVIEKTPRTNIRIRTLLPVKANGLDGACTTDLSERGMFLRTTRPAAVNTRLSFTINLYDQIIAIKGVVIYNNRTAGTPRLDPGMGLEFISIQPGGQELIRRYIRNEITRGIVPE